MLSIFIFLICHSAFSSTFQRLYTSTCCYFLDRIIHISKSVSIQWPKKTGVRLAWVHHSVAQCNTDDIHLRNNPSDFCHSLSMTATVPQNLQNHCFLLYLYFFDLVSHTLVEIAAVLPVYSAGLDQYR